MQADAEQHGRVVCAWKKIIVVFSRKLYWLDGGGKQVPRKVAVMNLDGSDPRIIAQDSLNQLNFLHLDITRQMLYWSEGFAQMVSEKSLHCCRN